MTTKTSMEIDNNSINLNIHNMISVNASIDTNTNSETGIDVDASISIDTHQIQKDVETEKVVESEVKRIKKKVGKDLKKIKI